MVWSPFSNLLLYGKTADVKAAKAAGVPIGIGPDWAPSGSKNLLGELKVAKWFGDSIGGLCKAAEIVAMATSGAASILGWDKHLGSLEVGKRADLLVLRGTVDDPYEQLIAATERDVQLVVINGTPRYGDSKAMASIDGTGELAAIAGHSRKLNLIQPEEDPVMQGISYEAAHKKLVQSLANLPHLAGAALTSMLVSPAGDEKPQWFLALDELHPTGEELRPRIAATGPALELAPAARKAARQLKPLVLDGLTVVDDPTLLDRIAAQPNLPAELTTYLKSSYA
jgi:5-methylthioadenosine/S-adenosylhomocysteine deaminase